MPLFHMEDHMNYKAHYERLIERARTREKPTGYIEIHHVKPRCMGGTDEQENLVPLTPEEHFTAHLLLAKMYPKNVGLIMAARMMCMTSHGRNNKEYAWVRRRIAENMSDAIKEAWAKKYGFRDYMHQCEEVFNEFLRVRRKNISGKRWGMSEANAIQSVNVWAKITGQEQLVKDIVKEQKAISSRETAKRQWNDSESVEARREKSKNQNRKDRKTVSVDGVIYKSVSEVSKVLGNERGTVRRRCMSPDFPNWKFVDIE